MTDSSDPRRPKSSRKKPSREPATIDLKATVIDDGAAPAGSPGAEAQETLRQETLGRDTLGTGRVRAGHACGRAPAPETMTAAGTPDVQPEETTVGGSEPPAEDLAASRQATLDSGIGTDTLPSGEEPGRPDATSSDSFFQETSTFADA